MAGEERGLAEWAAAEVLSETPPAPVVAPTPAAPTPAPEPVAVVEAAPAAAVEAVPAEPVVVEEVPPTTEPTPAPTPEPVAAEPDPSPAPAPAPTKGKIQPLPEWMKDRLSEQTAKQRTAEAKAAEETAKAQVLEAENRALRERLAAAGGVAPTPAAPVEPDPAAAPIAATPQPAPAPAPTPRPAAVAATPPGFVPVSQVQAEAQRIANEQAFNEKANAQYEAGIKAYPDFKEAVGILQEVGLAGRLDFQQAAMATGSMADVIHHLGSNPDEANRIRLSLVAGDTPKAVADMTKIAISIDAQKAARLVADTKRPKASMAPAPIRPVGGSSLPPQVDMDKLGDDEFTVELNKMLQAKGII